MQSHSNFRHVLMCKTSKLVAHWAHESQTQWLETHSVWHTELDSLLSERLWHKHLTALRTDLNRIQLTAVSARTLRKVLAQRNPVDRAPPSPAAAAEYPLKTPTIHSKLCRRGLCPASGPSLYLIHPGYLPIMALTPPPTRLEATGSSVLAVERSRVNL